MKNFELKQIKKWQPCEVAVKSFTKRFGDRAGVPMPELLDWLAKHPDWGCWLLSRITTRKKYLRMAIWEAESVAHLNPDPRVRAAVESAKAVLKKDSKKTRATAGAAAGATARAATFAAWRKIYMEERP